MLHTREYSGTYFFSFLITPSGIASLSKVFSASMKLESPSIFFAVSQSGFSCRSVQTASIVSITRGGGLEKDFISTMSPLLRALSDLTALSRTGKASARSALASSAMTCTSFWKANTSAASFSTTRWTLAASSLSFATVTKSAAVAFDFSSRMGCSSPVPRWEP